MHICSMTLQFPWVLSNTTMSWTSKWLWQSMSYFIPKDNDVVLVIINSNLGQKLSLFGRWAISFSTVTNIGHNASFPIYFGKLLAYYHFSSHGVALVLINSFCAFMQAAGNLLLCGSPLRSSSRKGGALYNTQILLLSPYKILAVSPFLLFYLFPCLWVDR